MKELEELDIGNGTFNQLVTKINYGMKCNSGANPQPKTFKKIKMDIRQCTHTPSGQNALCFYTAFPQE
jgi:hypothetical protein